MSGGISIHDQWVGHWTDQHSSMQFGSIHYQCELNHRSTGSLVSFSWWPWSFFIVWVGLWVGLVWTYGISKLSTASMDAVNPHVRGWQCWTSHHCCAPPLVRASDGQSGHRMVIQGIGWSARCIPVNHLQQFKYYPIYWKQKKQTRLPFMGSIVISWMSE